MTANEQLTRFGKARETIVGRVKGSESPSFQGPQSHEEDLVVRNRVPNRTERISFIEPFTNGNHEPIGQAHNNGSSGNHKEIPVSMDNVFLEGTGEQYVTSPSGKALGSNFHVGKEKDLIHRSEADIDMGTNGGTHH